MEELIEVLKDIRNDVDFDNCEDLVDGCVLNSFDIILIVAALNEEFDVEIAAVDIVPENFNSASRMWDMIQRLAE